ncbi:unnamed protein product [Mycena citricolor]|uniref:Uncharacterized protein n=1 Tax=Mycena citricolor TaxID=2018698 RepID=A0AAD2H580_9AGAR|nr:unnamed protein product [Mycena citricolor]
MAPPASPSTPSHPETPDDSGGLCERPAMSTVGTLFAYTSDGGYELSPYSIASSSYLSLDLSEDTSGVEYSPFEYGLLDPARESPRSIWLQTHYAFLPEDEPPYDAQSPPPATELSPIMQGLCLKDTPIESDCQNDGAVCATFGMFDSFGVAEHSLLFETPPPLSGTQKLCLRAGSQPDLLHPNTALGTDRSGDHRRWSDVGRRPTYDYRFLQPQASPSGSFSDYALSSGLPSPSASPVFGASTSSIPLPAPVSRANTLASEKRRKHERRFQCSMCTLRFTTKSGVRMAGRRVKDAATSP